MKYRKVLINVLICKYYVIQNNFIQAECPQFQVHYAYIIMLTLLCLHSCLINNWNLSHCQWEAEQASPKTNFDTRSLGVPISKFFIYNKNNHKWLHYLFVNISKALMFS